MATSWKAIRVETQDPMARDPKMQASPGIGGRGGLKPSWSAWEAARDGWRFSGWSAETDRWVPGGMGSSSYKSRPQNVFDGGQRPMMVGGQGYQGPMGWLEARVLGEC